MTDKIREEKVLQTVLEMFQQRGYTNILKKGEIITAVKSNGKKVCMFCGIVFKLNVEEIQKYIASLAELKIRHGVIVYESLTPAVKEVIKNAPNIQLTVEIFLADTLQYNITKHSLVPQHDRLSKEEGKEFKEKYGTKFPILLRTDPIAKFYNFERGDVISVTRNNGFVMARIVH